MGLRLELSGVELEGLIPPSLGACNVDEFMSRLPRARRADVETPRGRARQTARCCATWPRSTPAPSQATVGLVELDRTHPFANINLTDNIVRFVTSRYDQNPLVVQGPGAGPAVTAGGVFADLLRVCAYLGAKL